MRSLEKKIPPPAVMLVLGFFAWLGARVLPSLSFALVGQSAAALALMLGGLALNLGPKLVFARVGTTVNPLKPGSSTRLVTSGIYRYTRNPMYLGQATILLGWVIYLGNVASLAVVPAFVLYISRFQIQPEERYLSTLFPERYAAFVKQTRRWF